MDNKIKYFKLLKKLGGIFFLIFIIALAIDVIISVFIQKNYSIITNVMKLFLYLSVFVAIWFFITRKISFTGFFNYFCLCAGLETSIAVIGNTYFT